MKTQDESELKKEDFVNIVLHELRSPLTAIQAAVKLVSAGILGGTTPDQKKALDLAHDNIMRMGRMINQLLDLAKVESGWLELRRERVDLVLLVRDLLNSLEPLASERRLKLLLDCQVPRLDVFVERDKVIQIFSNLLHNALKFTAQGYVSVSLQDLGSDIRCEVRDTGPGFRAKDLAEIFHKFKRFGAPVRSGDKGTGLGLALTKRLVELHGGKIHVDSRPGEGARFVFTLPRIGAEDLFRQEVSRLLLHAHENAKPLSLIQMRVHEWPRAAAQLGPTGSAAVLNHLESLLKAMLRDDSDFVVQSQGALWLAVFSVDRAGGQRIVERIKKNMRDEVLRQLTDISVDLDVQLVVYPEDGQEASDLLSLLSADPALH